MKKYVVTFWPLGVIFLLWFIFSAPYFIKGRVPFPSSYLVSSFPPWNATHGEAVKNSAMPDTISQIYPWKNLSIQQWKQGNIPLWNPYSFSGTVHAANYQSAVFTPVNILFFIFPFLDAWSVMILLQPLLAGFGMYVFLRSQNIRKFPGLIGTISFMFCGFMTAWMAYGTLGYAALVLPWTFWAVTKSFLRPTTWHPVLVTVFIALSFLSGHFQISMYVFCAVSAYIVFETVRQRDYSRGLLIWLYALLGLGLASPQLMLTENAYRDSERSGSFVKGEVIPWQYFVTLFSPDFYGNPVTRNDWFGHYAEWASYIGIIPLFGSLAGVFLSKLKPRIFFIFLAVFSFLLAYPTPLVDVLFGLKLPAISTSAASRIMILFSFSLAVLCAFGFQEITAMWSKGNYKRIFPLGIGFICILVVVWAIVLVFNPFPIDKLIIARRNVLLPTLLSIACLIIVSLGYLKSKVIKIVTIVSLVLLTCFDMYRFSSKWMPFDSRDNVYPRVRSLEYLNKYAGFNRVFGNLGNEVGSTFNIQLIEGYDAMYQARYGEFMQSVSKGFITPADRSVVQFDKNGLYKTEALQLLGVRYIYHRKSDGRNVWAFPYWEYTETGSMRQVYSDEDYWIYEYTDAFPRAFLASDYMVSRNDDQTIKDLFSPEFNRRETLVLESEPGIRPQAGTGKADIKVYEPNRVEIHTSAQVPKLLFLSDAYDAGWKATVDGKKAPILRADYDFRAVAVPTGDHTIIFTYFPDRLLLGLYIAAASSLFAFLILFLYKIYENRHL